MWTSSRGLVMKDSRWRSFCDARIFARGLRLTSVAEWEAWANTAARPRDIPAHPSRTYQDEWRGWDDWLVRQRSSGSECAGLARPAVQSRSQRSPSVPPAAAGAVFDFGRMVLDVPAYEDRVEGRPIALTAREFALLHLLAAHPRHTRWSE